MRTRTAPEDVVLGAAFRWHHIKVEVQDAAGLWQDRTEYLLSASFGADIDQPIAEARVKFRRENGPDSLSPLRGDSPLNTGGAAIDAGRGIRISPATTAFGVAPIGPDFKLLFLGVIDSVDFATSTIEVVARDLGGALVDAWIEADSNYGTEAGEPLEDVIQAVLDDWQSGVTLNVPDSPGFDVLAYKQEKASVFEVLRTLAGLPGWDIRYLWDSVTSSFRLTLFGPNRTKTVPDWTFAADRYFDVTQLAIDREFVRNYIVVTFTNVVTGARESVFATDPISEERFGHRWMEIEEASDSPIDTTAEAQALADAALSDLAWPIADKEIELPFFWPIDIGDLLRFTANNVHTDEDIDLAVTGYTHELSSKKERTRIAVRGKPAGFYRDWIRRSSQGGRTTEQAARDFSLYNLREIERTPTTITYAWERGADVGEVWVFEYLARNDELADAPDLFEQMGSTRPSHVLIDEDQITFELPPQGRLRFVQLEPRNSNLQRGPVYRLILTPAGTPPDRILSYSALVLDDGSVLVPIYVAEEVKSYRYAFNTGPDGATDWPTDLAVEGGLIRTITGFEILALPAGTVAHNEVIRLRAAAYINDNGTGQTNVTSDHSDIANAESVRRKPALSLEQGEASETTTTATHGAIVRDAGGYATALWYRTVEQGAPPSSWILKTSAPTNGVEYSATATLIEKHQVFIEWRLTGIRNGEDVVATLLSPGFDKGRIPNITAIAARLDEDAATGSIVVTLDSDGVGVRAVGNRLFIPTLADLQAAPLRNNGTRLLTPADFGELITGFTAGDNAYFGALPIGPNGEEGEPAYVHAKFGTIAPALEAGTTSEATSSATFGVYVNDPGGQADYLDVQIRSPGTAWPASWTRKSSTPADGVEYTETVPISKGHAAQIRFRLAYVLNGSALYSTIESPVFDVGYIAEVTLLAITFNALNEVLVSVGGDYDTRDDLVNPSLIVKVGIDVDPAAPTLVSNHGSVARRNGLSINTGVVCAPGSEARVKVIAISPSGVLGPVSFAKAVNGTATTGGGGDPGSTRFVEVSAKGGASGTANSEPNDATNLVSWSIIGSDGDSVTLQQYRYLDGEEVDFDSPNHTETGLLTAGANYPVHLHTYKHGTNQYIYYVYRLTLLDASSVVLDVRVTSPVPRLLFDLV